IYLGIGFSVLSICFACEDILEVPDITDQTVLILAPKEGSTIDINEVGFNWEALADATSYRIQIATPNFENALQFVMDSVVPVDTLGNVATRINVELTNGNYTWRIKALNSDYETSYSSSSFQVNGDVNADIIPPNTPQLVTPADGSSQNNTTVNFTWTREDVAGTAERDSIFIYSDANLQNLTMKAIGANNGFTTDLSAGTFYWLVRAYDAAANESENSDSYSFTIEE
ncbi:hypothetical protein GTQ34_16510, partial [Muricauda sp. JGD-17]|nr:hypothetical protein [Allomuricauda ochracea]